MQNLLDILLLLLEVILDGVKSDFPGNDVLNTNCKAILVEPVINQELGV